MWLKRVIFFNYQKYSFVPPLRGGGEDCGRGCQAIPGGLPGSILRNVARRCAIYSGLPQGAFGSPNIFFLDGMVQLPVATQGRIPFLQLVINRIIHFFLVWATSKLLEVSPQIIPRGKFMKILVLFRVGGNC
jgi:hypothetical protein